MEFDRWNPDERTLRYLLPLCISKNNPTFRSTGVEIDGSVYFTVYNLYKIAQRLRIDFDRTKTASNVYKKLEEKGYITIVTTQGHKTCVKLTSKGEEKCEDLKKLFDKDKGDKSGNN